LREKTEARDQLIAPTTRASAPDLSIGAFAKAYGTTDQDRYSG
jgi:hypothetical protein